MWKSVIIMQVLNTILAILQYICSDFQHGDMTEDSLPCLITLAAIILDYLCDLQVINSPIRWWHKTQNINNGNRNGNAGTPTLRPFFNSIATSRPENQRKAKG